MIKKQYTGNARRARNIIWNAAGRYDFDPPFMAFFANGVPDTYFNMVAGLVAKWLDLPSILHFFLEYESDHRAAEFDDLLWLGLENCVYEKELPERPHLEALRKRRAERFYEEQASYSRQQMAYQSMMVYTQQEFRWAGISGRRRPLMTPREARMAEALRFSGSLGTEELLTEMRRFLMDFFHYDPGRSREKRGIGANPLLRAILRHEGNAKDRLLVRMGSGEGNHPKAVQQRHIRTIRRSDPTEKDAAYIRDVFGRSLLSEGELRILERELCIGSDEGCRLWVTRGDKVETTDKDALEVRESAARQQKKNEEWFREHAALLSGSMRALAAKLETVLSSYYMHVPEMSRAGRVRSEVVWRLPVINDNRVFLRSGEETEPELCVDLLLDASQSRMHSQEVLAAEAWIICRSFEKNHIPVRVHMFRSLRGFTVLECLRSFGERDSRALLRYYAGGWNRDGLAIEALARMGDGHSAHSFAGAGSISSGSAFGGAGTGFSGPAFAGMDSSASVQGKTRFLLILTDAAPNDSHPLAAEGLNLPKEYEGAAAVTAAQEAVRIVRSQGLRVGAVFHGNTSHLENVHQIYGQNYVRIRQASQLAEGVSELFLKLMRGGK